jgi:SAM-dependent methyltransferase
MQIPYSAECYDIRTIRDAKTIILTPEDSTTDERWENETPYLGDLIARQLRLQDRHRVLDYGCGIGRMAKDLIHRTGCSVIGVDTSVSMRSLAPSYVLDDRFLACAPGMLDAVSDMHFAIAVWTLQHILDLDNAISLIQRKLRSFGVLMVVNNQHRALPTTRGEWMDDNRNLRTQLANRFVEIEYGALDSARTSPRTARSSFWGCYKKRT